MSEQLFLGAGATFLVVVSVALFVKGRMESNVLMLELALVQLGVVAIILADLLPLDNSPARRPVLYVGITIIACTVGRSLWRRRRPPAVQKEP
jgi:hypothetical protein